MDFQSFQNHQVSPAFPSYLRIPFSKSFQFLSAISVLWRSDQSWIFAFFFLSCRQTRQACTFWLYAISTSKVYLYITTVQSGSLACKIGVLHIYIRYTIIYYHNKTEANKKNKRTTYLNTLSFLQFSQHFYKTRKTDSQYYYYHYYYYNHCHHHCQYLLFYRTPVSTKGLCTMCLDGRILVLLISEINIDRDLSVWCHQPTKMLIKCFVSPKEWHMPVKSTKHHLCEISKKCTKHLQFAISSSGTSLRQRAFLFSV